MNRTSLIKLIHIARRDLQLDEETYRALLGTVVPGKSSCSDMAMPELLAVIKALEVKGFKSKPRPGARRRMSSPSAVSQKVRAVWRAMLSDGFIRDGSDAALDRYVQRQTRLRNGGAGVATLEWLRAEAEDNLLESLKQWHIREMKKALQAHNLRLPVNPRSGDDYRDYDTICWAFSEAAKKWK